MNFLADRETFKSTLSPKLIKAGVTEMLFAPQLVFCLSFTVRLIAKAIGQLAVENFRPLLMSLSVTWILIRSICFLPFWGYTNYVAES